MGKNQVVTAKVAYRSALSKVFFGNDGTEKLDGAYDDIWKEKPPSVMEFFDLENGWFKEPFYPIQNDFVRELIGNDSLVWDNRYDEGHAFWGKGSGKDRTIAKLIIYVIVKLLHMKNPQKGLELFIPSGDSTLGIDTPIDIANVSKDEKQAKNVFFKNLKSIISKVNDPKTGKNFFKQVGCDIREGKDLQQSSILFPHNITCHSLNSMRYAGEGLNLFFVAADEIGASPYERVRTQLISIRETIASRFPTIGKLLLMSFKYDVDCAMSIEFKLGLKDKRILSSTAATFEVNPQKKKETFKKFYLRDPIRATMTYECKSDINVGSGFIVQKDVIPWALKKGENPVVGDLISTDNLLGINFKHWFFSRLKGCNCAIHIDLAKGDIIGGQDSCGITMVHPIMVYPDIHPKVLEYLKISGIVNFDDELKIKRKGVNIDLALRITAPKGGEIRFSDIITFIKALKNKGVNIHIVTYDGWQSVGEIQRMNEFGIRAETLSIDRDNAPYDTLKELFYLGIVNGYNNSILKRELVDLLKNDKGKVDHPVISWLRMEQEGIDKGSKDVADSLAGSSYKAIKEIFLETGIVW